MQTAVILRISRAASMGEPHVWYEYALLVNNQIERQSPHMMATVESATRFAREQGYVPTGDVIDMQLEPGATPRTARATA
ncbi:hypothetical protein [Brevundimonas sp.]|uniref:hypothetical protein n=1 Tax=Brevundimonas sp. TaxID=1871086 RepID=UPI0028A78CB8|nr:hypothetical protein [Brevundimonas sp.]